MKRFYGNLEAARRTESWLLLKAIKPRVEVDWLYVGNFNEILNYSEKVGEVLRPYKQMEEFRWAVEECGLSDLGFMGNKFTWCNNRHGKAFTKKRLDRAYGNSQWHDTYSNTLSLSFQLKAQIIAHFSSRWITIRVYTVEEINLSDMKYAQHKEKIAIK